MGDDLFHRIFEIASLVALASAVVHIRPVGILSNASDRVDMFAFCISLTAAQFLILLRFAELYHYGVSEGTILKNMGLKDGMLFGVTFSISMAASIVAGMEYYGLDEEDADKENRMLAEEATATTTDVPIWLCLTSFVVYIAICTVRIMFFFPHDGSHKKYSKFFVASCPLCILIVRRSRQLNPSLFPCAFFDSFYQI